MLCVFPIFIKNTILPRSLYKMLYSCIWIASRLKLFEGQIICMICSRYA